MSTGTYIFLFMGIEGSTQHWERYPRAMQGALAQYDSLLHAVITAHHGRVVPTTGDGVLAVFTSAMKAAEAVLAAGTPFDASIEEWSTEQAYLEPFA